jgi:hypothetical protein
MYTNGAGIGLKYYIQTLHKQTQKVLRAQMLLRGQMLPRANLTAFSVVVRGHATLFMLQNAPGNWPQNHGPLSGSVAVGINTLYFYSLIAHDFRIPKKLVLMK